MRLHDTDVPFDRRKNGIGLLYTIVSGVRVVIKERGMDSGKIIDALKKTPIFAKTSDESLQSLLKSAIQKTVQAGTKIVEKGQSGLGFYLVLSGKADVMGGGKKLAEIGEGGFFGELSVIDGAPRTADVVAKTDVTCLVVSQWAMRSIIETHPEIALSMLDELARRLRATHEKDGMAS
ncbi:MAG: cyclic nucleotide-binding domain-containing protein [Candidatus Bipolaricaulia bacterium]